MIAALWTCIALLPQGEPRPDAVLVELPGGIAVTASEYREHLHRMLGGARLEELLVDRALGREVAARTAIPADVAARLADPDRAARRRVAAKIAEQFGGDPERHLEWRRTVGLTAAEELAAERVVAIREARVDALVRARRVVDEAALRRLFDARYGVDGIQVTVRHRLFDFADAQRRIEAGGGEASPERIEALARAAAESAQARVGGSGGEFASLDPEPIPGYRYQRFGVDFATAVRAAAVGAVVGPVRSAAGFHLLQVTERSRTRFETVREELVAELRDAPASPAEWHRLRRELIERYAIRAALDARDPGR